MRSQVEREPTLGSAFTGVKGGGPRVLQAHSLLMNLKHKSKNLKLGEREKKVVQMVSYQNQLRFLKQRCLSLGREPGSFSPKWLAMNSFKIGNFEWHL